MSTRSGGISSCPVPKSKQFMTSTFLSKRFAYSTLLKSSKKVKKLCGDKMEGDIDNLDETGADTIRRSRQNVAIATQVLSPRAFGSSFSKGREGKVFGYADEDEIGFFGGCRKRNIWNKWVFALIFSAAIVILIAIIVTIGYIKSQQYPNISARIPVNGWLIEKKMFDVDATTAKLPKSLDPTESEIFFPTAYSSFLVSSLTESNEDGKIVKAPKFAENVAGDPSESESQNEEEYLTKPQFFEDSFDDDLYDKDHGSPSEDRLFSSGYGYPHDFNYAGSQPTDDDGLFEASIREYDIDDERFKISENENNKDAVNSKEKVKVFDTRSAIDDDVFSIEVPIYTINRTITKAEPDRENDNESNGTLTRNNSTLIVLKKEEEEIIQDDDGKNKVRELKEIEKFENDNIQKEAKVENVALTKSAEETAEEKHLIDDNHDNNDNFHRAVLHTALFQNDYDQSFSKNHPNNRMELVQGKRIRLGVNRGRNVSKISRLENRIRERNRQIKFYRNSKNLNLNSTNRNETDGDGHVNVQRAESNTNGKPDTNFNDHADSEDLINAANLLFALPRKLSKTSFKATPEFKEEESPRLLQSLSKFPNLKTTLKTIFSPYFNLPFNNPNYEDDSSPDSNVYHQSHQQDPNIVPDVVSNLNPPISPLLLFSPSMASTERYHNLNSPDSSYSPTHAPLDFGQTEKYFDHLLGQNSGVGSISTVSGAGAPLSNIYFPALFPIQTTGAPQLSFDYSSSYIPQVTFGLPKPSSQIPLPFLSSDRASHFGFNTFNYSPFPNNLAHSIYNMNNSPDKDQSDFKKNLETLTTSIGQGQPPTYNSIGQGVHLFNIISGVIPQTYFHDKVYHNPSRTTFHQPNTILGVSNQPPGETKKKTPYFNPVPNLSKPSGALVDIHRIRINDIGHSHIPYIQVPLESNAEDSKHPIQRQLGRQSRLPDSRTNSNMKHVFHFEEDEPNTTAINDDDDQLLAPSTLIRRKEAFPTVSVAEKNYEAVTPLWNEYSSIAKNKAIEVSSQFSNESSKPKSFSFEILSKMHPNILGRYNWPSRMIDDTLGNLNPDKIHTELDSYTSKSKKKSGARLNLQYPQTFTNTSGYVISFPTDDRAISDSSQQKIKRGNSTASAIRTFQQNAIVDQEIHTKSLKVNKKEKKQRKSHTANNSLNLKSGFFIADM